MKKVKVWILGLLMTITIVGTGNPDPKHPGDVEIPEENVSNEIEILASIPSGLPIDKNVIQMRLSDYSGYGYRMHPIHKVRKKHAGIDLPASTGTPVVCTSYGTVKNVINSKSGYGKHVIVESGKYEIVYGHLSKILVTVGQKLKMGDSIGEVGSTGTSTAPHLHYEIRISGEAINPIEYMGPL